jgi:hypothetical protein
MATEEPADAEPTGTGPDQGKVLDLLVKATVVLAAILYGFGFLIISIHQYSYGLTEMNLLRPKVLAAGIWFLAFVTIPFVLVLEESVIKFKYSSPECENWLRRRSTTFYFTALSCFWLGMILSSTVFGFETGAMPAGPSTGILILVMVVSAGLVVADQVPRFPHWLAVVAAIAFGGLLLYCGIRDMAYYHGESVASVALWFIVISYFASIELQSRSWKPQTGNWKQSLFLSLGAVAGFATLYYPHIKPSWGGGAPTPATIYFSKDSLVLPGRSVSANILDEVDSGFYIIGGNDKKATFIPRSEVSAVYYSDDASGSFVVRGK